MCGTRAVVAKFSKSVTESLLRAYKIASKMGTTSKIAIVDLHEAIGYRELAQCNAVQSLDLQQYTREYYTGSGEWLIWGATSAIVGTASLADMDSLPTVPGHDDPFSVSSLNSHLKSSWPPGVTFYVLLTSKSMYTRVVLIRDV